MWRPCVCTAVIIALLWGGNLTAVFPIVEVIMNDHSLPEWIDQKTEEAQLEVSDAQRWLAQLEKIKGGDPQGIKSKIEAEIDRRSAELAEHKKKISRHVG